MDPFPLPDYKAESWSTFELTNGVLYGLSTIYRTGQIQIAFEKNSVHVTLHLGAENLKGSIYHSIPECMCFLGSNLSSYYYCISLGRYNWTLGVMQNMVSRHGVMEFNLEYITAEVKLQQPANLDKLPSMEKIDLDIGNIAVLSDGAGTLDYIVEAVFNVLPNVFRKQIIDSLEAPVCKAIEDELQKLNLEGMIEQNL